MQKFLRYATGAIGCKGSTRQPASHALQVPLQDDLNPIKVLQLFSAVSDEDCELLDLAGRPERLILTYLAVPPVAIRPSVESFEASGVNEDDATLKIGVRAWAFCATVTKCCFVGMIRERC